jgi:hypothetical protein
VRAFFDRRPRPAAIRHGLLEAILAEGELHGENPA